MAIVIYSQAASQILLADSTHGGFTTPDALPLVNSQPASDLALQSLAVNAMRAAQAYFTGLGIATFKPLNQNQNQNQNNVP